MTSPAYTHAGTARTCVRCQRQQYFIAGRGLCGACYAFVRRNGELDEWPRAGRGHDRAPINSCPDCVVAVRLEVSSAMRDNAFVAACPHRMAVAS